MAQNDIAGYAREAARLLSSEDVWRRCSRRAVASALENSGIDAVAARWSRHLRGVRRIDPQSGAVLERLEMPRGRE